MELSKRMLVGIVMLSFLGGMVAAGSMGYGPLAYISFQIQGSSGGGGGGSLLTTPAYIDLGTINAGDSGSFTAEASLEIPSSGYYEFDLENEGQLEKAFSYFVVTINVGGDTVVLSLYGDDSEKIYLDPGTYDVSITVDYTVKNNPQLTNAQDLLFLKVKAEDES
ncbi:MAG: hypothetical protein GSR85_10870 [Desulfurococcales archaeon]|nr:hypothetical protein [Desulfurococcales archaeon]